MDKILVGEHEGEMVVFITGGFVKVLEGSKQEFYVIDYDKFNEMIKEYLDQ